MTLAVRLLGFALLLFAQVGSTQTLQPPLHLVGSADYYELHKYFYKARLFASNTGVATADELLSVLQPKRMEIEVTTDRWSPRRFADQWLQALSINNAPEVVAGFESELHRFVDVAKADLAEGDTIRIEADTHKTSVLLNDRLVFDTDKPGFAELLMTKWIGPRPPSTDFKHNILSGVDTLTASLR